MWLNSGTLENVMWGISIAIWNSVRENNNGESKRTHKQTCECYQCFSLCKLNLVHGPQDFTESYQCFSSWKLTLIHGNQHSQHPKKKKKTETPKQSGRQQKIQGSNRSKDREIELINKKFEGKEKVFNTKEIDWYYIIWE